MARVALAVDGDVGDGVVVRWGGAGARGCAGAGGGGALCARPRPRLVRQPHPLRLLPLRTDCPTRAVVNLRLGLKNYWNKTKL